jgi:hypothetical protein
MKRVGIAVMVRIVQTPDTTYLDARGAVYFRLVRR